MKKAIFFFAIATLLCGDMLLQAQDITGTWEGRLDGRQFLQLNIVQVGKVVCGYSWDHDNINTKSYCMARFMGRLDEVENEWVLTGYSFIEQSGDHDLMTFEVSCPAADRANSMKRLPPAGLRAPRTSAMLATETTLGRA